mgnify:CR=1 FL=1
MSHYVAGIDIDMFARTAVAAEPKIDAFATFYKAVGVHYLETVMDGDCGIDVMTLIMGVERSKHERNSLRVELSDFLMARLQTPWMIDLLVCTQELNHEDVRIAMHDETQIGQELTPSPHAFETAVSAICIDDAELAPVSEDALDALRWASRLPDDLQVLALARSLPAQVVHEQIRLWKARDTAVAANLSLIHI